MTKKILSVDYDFPGGEVQYLSINSSQSLLDADIIVIEPSFSVYSSRENYMGKRQITESDSMSLAEDIYRMNREIDSCLDEGKTIIVFLGRIEDVYIYTGKKEYSGTGRNQKVTHIVEQISPLRLLPIKLGRVVPSSGTEIKIGRELGVLSTYWKLFGKDSNYQSYIENDKLKPLLTTKNGKNVVGTIINVSSGHIVVLPKLEYPENCVEVDDGEEVWTDEGVTFGNKLIHTIIEIDKELHQENAKTPKPDWIKDSIYQSGIEKELVGKIENTLAQIRTLEDTKCDLELELENEESLKNLLFETGKQLEETIISALKILGFSVERYKENDSEFDSVFLSEEGRFLGEAEGRDNKAIAVEKLSQLMRNIAEDLTREEIDEPAEGVLFGNAFRLSKPEERGEFFTQKCLISAKREGIALVKTPDLFWVAEYLKRTNDEEFAKKCREAFFMSKGEIVQFPQIPS